MTTIVHLIKSFTLWEIVILSPLLLSACSPNEHGEASEPSFQYIEAKETGGAMIFDRRSGCVAQIAFSEHHASELPSDAKPAKKSAVSRSANDEVVEFNPEGDWTSASATTTVAQIGGWTCPQPIDGEKAKK